MAMTTSSIKNPLLSLPHDTLIHAFSYLDVGSLRQFSFVCKQGCEIANDNALWLALLVRRSGEELTRKITAGWEKHSLQLLFTQVTRRGLACTQTLTMRGHRGPVTCLLMDPASGILYSGQLNAQDNIAKSWNADTGKPAVSFLHNGSCRALALNSDRNILYAVKYLGQGNIYQFCTQTGKQLDTLEDDSGEIFSLAFDPKLNVLFSGSSGGDIKVWDVSRNALLRTLQYPLGAINCLAIDQDREVLYAGSSLGFITLWNTRTGEPLNFLWRNPSPISCFALDRNADNERVLFAGSMDGHITVWNVETRKVLRAHKAHLNDVRCLALGCDDLGRKVLYSGGGSDAIRAWDANAGKPLNTMGSHQGVSCHSFALGEGNVLYVACHDGAVRQLSRRTNAISEDVWMQLAEDIAKRQFCKFSQDTSFKHRLGAMPPRETTRYDKALVTARELSNAQKLTTDQVTVLAIRCLLHPKLVEIFSEQSSKKRFFDSLGHVMGGRDRMKSPEVAFYGNGDDFAFATCADIEQALASPVQTHSVTSTSSLTTSSVSLAQIRQAMKGFSSTSTTSSASSQEFGKASQILTDPGTKPSFGSDMSLIPDHYRQERKQERKNDAR